MSENVNVETRTDVTETLAPATSAAGRDHGENRRSSRTTGMHPSQFAAYPAGRGVATVVLPDAADETHLPVAARLGLRAKRYVARVRAARRIAPVVRAS